MSRRLYLDDGPGEVRGVVVLDGQPERLLIHRADRPAGERPGARWAARVRRIDRALATAFLDLGDAPDAVMPLSAGLTEGARLEVEIAAPSRLGKGAVARLVGPGEGAPRLLADAPPPEAWLQAFAPQAVMERGDAARAAADVAEEVALAVLHRLPSGGGLSIEPTRALVAIDVDVGSTAGDARGAAVRTNREAIAAAARLLRLKGLGGRVVFDLAGRGHDGDSLKAAASAAFQPDQPDVAFGPITRFGLWPLTLPRRAAPLAELLCDVDGAPTVETRALRLLRAIERAAGPGQRVTAQAAPAVAERAQALSVALLDRIGPRFHIEADPACAPDAPTVRSL